MAKNSGPKARQKNAAKNRAPGDFAPAADHIGGGTGPASKRVSAALMLSTSAILLVLLFPPFYCFFLAPVALVPFCLCILRRPMTWRYLGAYYLAGAGFFLAGLYWICPVTVLGYIALALFVGLYFALFAWGMHRLVVQMRLPAMIAVPLVWTAVEYLRASFVLGGFPWFLLGNALAPSAILIQAADLFGVWGLTFLIAMINGFVVDVWRLPLRKNGRSNPPVARMIRRMLVITALTILSTIGYGAYRLQETTTKPGPRVAVIQEDIPQSLKQKKEAEDEIFLKHLRLTDQALAAEPKPDLVVWPETMVPAWINEENIRGRPDPFHNDEELKVALARATQTDDELQRIDDVFKALKDRVHTTGVPLLLGYGAVIYREKPLPLEIQNRTMLLTPGELIPGGREETVRETEYSKVHLVPFGEFIPFRNLPLISTLMKSLTPGDFDYSNTAGTQWTRFHLLVTSEQFELSVAPPAPASPPPPTTAPTTPASAPSPPALAIDRSTKFYTFATPICFEDTMPAPARMMSAPQFAAGRKTDFLLNVSNDGWFWGTELEQHLQACQLRAVENRIAIARSVNTGNSGFIDSNGRIMGLVRGADGRSLGAIGTLAMTVPVDSRISLYSEIGDLLPIACGIASALLVGWTIVRPRRGRRSDGAVQPD